MEHGIYIAVFYIFSFIELMRFLLEKTQVLKMFVLDLCLLYFMINKKKRKSNNKNNNYYKKLDNRKTWGFFFSVVQGRTERATVGAEHKNMLLKVDYIFTYFFRSMALKSMLLKCYQVIW